MHMEVHYMNNSYPYSTTGSFMEYFERLTNEHVNFIFFGASHAQETVYQSINTSYYKFGYADSWSTLYFDHAQSYQIHGHGSTIDERRRLQSVSTFPDEQSLGTRVWEENVSPNTSDRNTECPRRHQNYREYQTVWQDTVDTDHMTYEELVDLGEAVGTQSRGLTQELIALLPVSKYKCGFFSRKKSRNERCVICQMEYKRREQMITLPCKHRYHTACGTQWLSINKACPICYTEVFGDTSKH